LRADEAQAAIARCLVDPEYMLRQLSGECSPTPLSSLLLAELRLFRGFITKIKHTQLRRIAPLTLRLLALHKLEISFFSEIAPSYQRARLAGSLSPTALFLRFERDLVDFLVHVPPEVSQQLDAVLRHEHRIWGAGRSSIYPDPVPYPRLRPGVAVERFALDVLELAAAVSANQFAVPKATAGEYYLLYRPAAGTVRVEGIDALSAWMLSRLDGLTSAGALGAALTNLVGSDAHSVVADLLSDASARGLLDSTVRPIER
jgi:hypothetical protein